MRFSARRARTFFLWMRFSVKGKYEDGQLVLMVPCSSLDKNYPEMMLLSSLAVPSPENVRDCIHKQHLNL